MRQGDTPDETHLTIYREEFQYPFLSATAAYYRYKSVNFLATHSVVEYIILAESCLEKEANLVNLCLHNTTKKPLLLRCEDVLIEQHKETLGAQFQSLLDAERQTDLKRLYNLMMRSWKGLNVAKTKFEANVRKAKLALEKLDKSAPRGKMDVALLDLYKTYHALIMNTFREDPEFIKCLDNVCILRVWLILGF